MTNLGLNGHETKKVRAAPSALSASAARKSYVSDSDDYLRMTFLVFTEPSA